MIAVANSQDRKDIQSNLPKNTKFFTYIHPTALIMDSNIEIGEGSFIGAYSILTTNIKIGKHTILNRGNHIGHNCNIGDYFSLMPGAIISGDCNIGSNVFVGSISTIKEKLTLCNDLIIGLNSGITKNIFESGTYIGTPAKKMSV